MDLATLERWIQKAGFSARPDEALTLRIETDGDEELPPFFVQLSEHWVLLSMLPMLKANAFRPDDLGHRLLAANREMRVAKYALEETGDVVLCAELPTESLDESELTDAVARMIEYARGFRTEFGSG